MPARDARVDDRDADALAGDAVLLTRERRADRQAGALHRRERGPIDHDALNARVGRDRGQRDVVDLANLGRCDRAGVRRRRVRRRARPHRL